ncbi:putative signal transduction protein with CBS domains [Flexistipes sinusarabici DSM 4947]|uniref:Signal transduction protein with CBS domains n=1 Tax=Flexistipes sinusarabici (strain ATCC 49648 / DSM 4947 / MAS 10) TaxID=717231 RepID=F8E8G2_FLESM|nr:CBS domain-containing protein [Flexistipes sinusarabici]AEI14011.1 putative signal transduction protein with CBS domains [Flexistipes sinusarabici DSM 4947]
MSTVKDILSKKESQVYTVSPEKTVFEALKIMSDEDIGALIVTEGDNVKGIFSERDYARKVILKGKSSKDLKVSDIMTTDVLFVTPKNTVEECMALMTEKRIRHLPVLENKKLTGLVSIGDIVKQVISDHKFTIKELEKYISGDIAG